MSAAFISRVEAGRRVPSPQVLRILAERLGVSVAELAGRPQEERLSERDLSAAELAARLGEPQAEAQIRALLAQAGELGDRPGQSRLVEALGQLRLAARDDEAAVRLFEEARELVDDVSPRARPALYEGLGRAYAGLGDLARAVNVLRAAFDDAADEPADPALVLRFGVFLANAYTDQGAPALAVSVLTDVVAHEARLADPLAKAKLEWTLCRTYGEAGRSDIAQRHARRVIALLEHSEESQLRGRAQLLLAATLLTAGDGAAAEPALELAGQLMVSAPGPELAVLHYWQARAALARGDDDDAGALARRSIAETEATEPSTAGMAYVVLAQVAERRRELDDGRFLCRRALELLRGTSANHYIATAYETLADIEEAAGDMPAALRAARAAVETHKRDSAAAGLHDVST